MVVPPANPPDKNEDTIELLFAIVVNCIRSAMVVAVVISEGGIGTETGTCSINDRMVDLYESINIKLRAEPPAWRKTFSVFPLQNATVPPSVV